MIRKYDSILSTKSTKQQIHWPIYLPSSVILKKSLPELSGVELDAELTAA